MSAARQYRMDAAVQREIAADPLGYNRRTPMNDAAFKRDIAVAFLCDNLMEGRDPFAGFPASPGEARPTSPRAGLRGDYSEGGE